MQLLIQLSILLFFSLSSYSQINPKVSVNQQNKEIPDSIFWKAFYLLDNFEYVTSSKDGIRFYNAKVPISRNKDIVKIEEMVYFPNFTSVKSKKYKNVIMYETIEFDCKNNRYRILKIKYLSDFVNLFNEVENPDGKYEPITKGTIWQALLDYSCNIKDNTKSLNIEKDIQNEKIISKDGVVLGDKIEFMSGCTKSGKNGVIYIKGVELDVTKYCSCVCDNLFPQLNSEEIFEIQKKFNLETFINNDKCWNVLKDCIIPNSKIQDDYKFESSKNEFAILKKRLTKDCVTELQNNNDLKEISPSVAENYCSCMVDKLYSNSYNYRDMTEITDKNSKAYNEILLTCMNDVLVQSGVGSNKNYSEIIGNEAFSKISLIDYFGKGYKIKISIDGIVKYFLFDTGASDILIDRDTERELLLNGTLKKENYIKKTQYVLANNQIVNAQVVLINNIKIGDYILNNVKVAILDEGDLLCGKSFLDRFKKWEVDKVNKQLILYK